MSLASDHHARKSVSNTRAVLADPNTPLTSRVSGRFLATSSRTEVEHVLSKTVSYVRTKVRTYRCSSAFSQWNCHTGCVWTVETWQCRERDSIAREGGLGHEPWLNSPIRLDSLLGTPLLERPAVAGRQLCDLAPPDLFRPAQDDEDGRSHDPGSPFASRVSCGGVRPPRPSHSPEPTAVDQQTMRQTSQWQGRRT